MGEKGAKLTSDAATVAESVSERLSAIGKVSHRKMFGGVGIFEDDKMFAMVDSKGEIFLKIGDSNRQRFEKAGSVQHGKMPYSSVPTRVLEDDAELIAWATSSIALAHS